MAAGGPRPRAQGCRGSWPTGLTSWGTQAGGTFLATCVSLHSWAVGWIRRHLLPSGLGPMTTSALRGATSAGRAQSPPRQALSPFLAGGPSANPLTSLLLRLYLQGAASATLEGCDGWWPCVTDQLATSYVVSCIKLNQPQVTAAGGGEEGHQEEADGWPVPTCQGLGGHSGRGRVRQAPVPSWAVGRRFRPAARPLCSRPPA